MRPNPLSAISTTDGDGVGPAAARSAAAGRFRVRQVYVGVAATIASVLMVFGYEHVHEHWAGRHGQILALLGAATAASLALVYLGPKAAKSRYHQMFFLCWSLWTVALVLLLVAADGGGRSPIAVLLFIALLFAALGYSSWMVLLLGAFEVSGYVVVCAATGTLTLRLLYPMAGSLVLATIMATLSARNREQQDRELLEMARLLEAEATHDRLTGCLNRRGLDPVFHAEVGRAMRYRRPLSVLLVDLDRLKEINDGLGHHAGDLALQQVAKALLSACRETDFAARIGGDEFVVLAPETTLAEAWALGERIRGALHRSEGQLRVTVSVGLASIAKTQPTPEALLAAADASLYQAKAAGRDRTAIPPDAGQVPAQTSRSTRSSSSA